MNVRFRGIVLTTVLLAVRWPQARLGPTGRSRIPGRGHRAARAGPRGILGEGPSAHALRAAGRGAAPVGVGAARVAASSSSANTQTVDDSAGDNDGTLEPGEPLALTQPLRNAGSAGASGVRATLTEAPPELTLSQAASAYPDVDVGAAQANTTPYTGMLAAEAACGRPVTAGLRVTSAQGPFTVPVSVPTGVVGAAQTFTATPGETIPDNSPTGAVSTLAVSGVGALGDLDVRVNIRHTFDGDLEIRLRAPDGTTIALVSNRGGLGQNFVDTDLDDEAPTAIAAGSAPFTGSFRPEQPLSVLDGRNANGTWTLTVVDNARADLGAVDSWRLSARSVTCSPPPATPSLSATAPPSPAGQTTPQITGTAPGDSTVRLYTGGSCTGTPAGTGSAASLASPGIEIAVPAGQTTQIRGTATLGGLTSVCSPPLAYPPSAQPPPAPTATPPAPTPPATPTSTLPRATPPRDRTVSLTLTAAASQRALRQRALRLTALCAAEPCKVSVGGVVSLPSAKRGAKARGVKTSAARKALRKGQRAALTLKLSSSLRKRLAGALRSRRTRSRVRATITATAVDAAGNRRTKRVTIRLRR